MDAERVLNRDLPDGGASLPAAYPWSRATLDGWQEEGTFRFRLELVAPKATPTAGPPASPEAATTAAPDDERGGP